MEVNEHRTSIPHVSALDGARGAAVAGVLLFHGGHLTGGYLGVDLFFTLSGFLITSLLLAEVARSGSVGLGGFWARRARRLLPALGVLILGVAFYALFVATPQQLTQIRGDGLATLVYGANWRAVFSTQIYFALFTAPSPLQHTWSLAIEEQFYVIWPLVFVALAAVFQRSLRKAVLLTALVLAAGSSVLMFVLYNPNNTNRVYYGTDTRAAAVLLGASLAAWLAIHGPAKQRYSRIVLEVFGLAGVALLVLAWTRLDGQSPTLYQGGFLAVGVAATVVIAAAVHPKTGPIARVLSFQPLCALGVISYGVYLYHWPLDIVLDSQRVALTGWPLFALQTGATLVIATISFRFIEQPIRRGALSAVQWRRLVPPLAAALVVGFVLATTLGAKSEPSAVVNYHLLQSATRAYQTSPPGSARILVVGNSIAAHIGTDGFGPVSDAHGSHLDVFNAGLDSCTFPPDLAGPQADPYGRIFAHPPCPSGAGVVARYRPNIALWIMGNQYSGNLTYRGHRVHTCTATYDSLYTQRLEQEVAILGATGARVVLTTNAYPRYLGYSSAADRAIDCDNQLRRDVAATTGALLVDLNGYICPHDHRCRVEQNGVTLRPDGIHYTGKGAVIVARWLLEQVTRR